MGRRVCFFVAFGLLIVYTFALEESSSKQANFDAVTNGDDDDDNYEDDDYDYALQDKKGIKHKHKQKLKLLLLGGGLKSLLTFIAIKIKIILIVVTVIGIIGFTLKVFGALKYAGYIGGNDCPVMHEGPVIHEPAYGLGYSATPPPPDHNAEYEPWNSDHSDWPSSPGPPGYARSLLSNYIDTDFMSHAFKNMDIAETVFGALEMDDDQCRRRLVCEIDAKTREIPFISYAMDFFSHGFEKYRTSGETKFKECAKLYSGCEKEKESRKRRKRFAGKKKPRNYMPT